MDSWQWTDETLSGEEKLLMINSRWCVSGPEVGPVPGSQQCVCLRCCFSSAPTAAPQTDCECVYSTPAPPGGCGVTLAGVRSRDQAVFSGLVFMFTHHAQKTNTTIKSLDVSLSSELKHFLSDVAVLFNFYVFSWMDYGL